MKRLLMLTIVMLAASLCLAASEAPLLLRQPTVSKTQIAFVYGGDIWIVNRTGGDAHRLVTGTGREIHPFFSPDGSMVAYTGNYDGNYDVYVVPAAGGEPARLTWHPGTDIAVGWSADGKSVLFRSHRNSPNDSDRLFLMPLKGGLPTQLPLSMAEEGSISPDGSHIAYNPILQWEPDWREYHGGQTAQVWIARLYDSSVVKVPHKNANDRDPMWIGDKVYFLSDRSGPATLYEYDTDRKTVTKLIDNNGYDIDSASAGPDAIVYSQMGKIFLYNLATKSISSIHIRVSGDMPQVRPHFEKVSKQIHGANISPTGARAVFEAHGDILTVPAEKGDIRDITSTPGVMERDPSWSPDGKWIAYFSDASGEYALYIRSQDGLKPARKIDLGDPPSFFYNPVWSPDSKKIAYSDKRLNLWVVDLDNPEPIKVDTNLFDSPVHEFDQAWSPDSRWITYTRQLKNHLEAVFVYSLSDRKATQVTDGMSDCLYPVFDRSGKYLFFTASTDVGLAAGWLDMTSVARPVTRSVYVAVLRSNLPSPLAPESDDEKVKDETGDKSGKNKSNDDKGTARKGKESEKTPDVKIDFPGILQRTLALPIPAANYAGMFAGKAGQLFLLKAPIVSVGIRRWSFTVQKFDLKKRKTKRLLGGIQDFVLSYDGNKMLYRRGQNWFISKTAAPPKSGKGKIDTADMQIYVVPRKEWDQMYRETWRIERDFFYDPHFHGLNLQAAEKTFRPYLAGIAGRDDLTFLFRRMLSYMSVGHMFVRGGTEPDISEVSVGLLGADYTVDHGRYRFSKIYSGENWNPRLKAPLTQPGVDIKKGDYLLAVNGRKLTDKENLYSYFMNTAGKQIVIRVGPNPDGSSARNVTVVPVRSEFRLRHEAWVEGNRRKVDELTGGKLAYVYLPDTARGGFTSFNRYYFAQVGKEGAVLDERYNHGGDIADYIIDYLNRVPMSRVMSREGVDYTEPTEAIFGPKAMIINQFAGSGGDAMPWYFRKAGIGPLVGKRTWGGLVGIGGYPILMDGGRVTAPRWAIYGLNGHWEVENHGIAPDVDVWQNPKLVRKGHDPQLEKAVEVLMQKIKEHPAPHYKRPAYPNYHPVLPPPGN